MRYATFEEWVLSDDFKQVTDTFGLNGMVTAIALSAWEAARAETESEVYEKLAHGLQTDN
jgi:hypothetical protein